MSFHLLNNHHRTHRKKWKKEKSPSKYLYSTNRKVIHFILPHQSIFACGSIVKANCGNIKTISSGLYQFNLFSAFNIDACVLFMISTTTTLKIWLDASQTIGFKAITKNSKVSLNIFRVYRSFLREKYAKL